MRDYGREVAQAAGDQEELLALAIELAVLAQAADSSAAKRAARAEARARQRDNRRQSLSVARQEATSGDTVRQEATVATNPPPPAPSLLSPTPPYNSSSPPTSREAHAARARTGWEELQAIPGWSTITASCFADGSAGEGAVDAIAGFLHSRRSSTWPAWVREMAKLVTGTPYSGADLGGACADCQALDKPIDGPHALRAFIAKRREERLKPPPGGVSAGAKVPTQEDRRQAEAREKRDEERRSKQEREYVTERDRRVADWEKSQPIERQRLAEEAERLFPGSGNMHELIRREHVTRKVCELIGFAQTLEDWRPEVRRVG